MPGLYTNILIYLGLILMLLYVLFFKVKNGRLIIDHIVLLFLGFSYYVYVPLYLYNKGSFIISEEAVAFNKINITDLNGFLVIFLGLIVTVCISDLRSKDMRLNPTKFGTPNFKLMKVILSILIVLTLYSVYPHSILL